MNIPDLINGLMQANQIPFDIIAPEHVKKTFANNDSNCRSVIARAVLLKDSIGNLLVIIPSNCLLDLSLLCETWGRNFQAVTGQSFKHICNQINLTNVPALPQLLNWPTLVDKQLCQYSDIYLDVGNNQDFIKIDQGNYKRLLGEALFAQLSIPITTLKAKMVTPQSDQTQITNAVHSFTSIRIKQRLEETIEFPPLPQTAQRILQLRMDPDANLSDLTQIVEADPSLAAQVVSWASSPYYAAPGEIKSVHDAIVRVLGYDLVVNLALGLSLGKSFKLPKDGLRGFTPYWHQAAFCASLVETLVKAMPNHVRPEIGLAYLAGLLHNFGYLILAHIFPQLFSLICRYIESNIHVNHTLIEYHLIGICREQIGSWLMQLWNLPQEVCIALRHQHDPDYDQEHCQYANLIHLALHLLNNHNAPNQLEDDHIHQVYQRLQLEPSLADQALQTVLAAKSELQTIACFMDRP